MNRRREMGAALNPKAGQHPLCGAVDLLFRLLLAPAIC